MLDCSETKSGINKNNLKYKEKWPIWHIGCKSFKNNINFEEQIVEHTSCEKYYAYIEGHNQQEWFAVPSSPICYVFPEFYSTSNNPIHGSYLPGFIFFFFFAHLVP